MKTARQDCPDDSTGVYAPISAWRRICLVIRGVNVFPSQIEALILRDKTLAPHYQLAAFHNDHMDAAIRAGIREPEEDVFSTWANGRPECLFIARSLE